MLWLTDIKSPALLCFTNQYQSKFISNLQVQIMNIFLNILSNFQYLVNRNEQKHSQIQFDNHYS